MILSSLSFFTRGQNHEILSRAYLSGEIKTLSGGIRSIGISETLPSLVYDRGADSLLTTVVSGSGSEWKLVSEGKISTGSIKPGQIPLLLGKTVYSRDMNGYAYSGGKLLLGSRISE